MERAKKYFGFTLAALALALLLPRASAQSGSGYNQPLFQYAIFYNLDLDISPGHTTTLGGPLFCNGNIWCYPGGQVTFNGTVEATGNYFFHWDTNGDQSANIAGTPLTPIFSDGQPVSGVDPATVSLGANNAVSLTNAEAMLNLPPANVRAPLTAAYAPTNQIYLFNAASLIVSNWYYGTNGVAPWSNNFTAYLQDSYIQPYYVQSNGVPMNWIELTNDYYVFSNRLNGVGKLFTTNYVPNFTFTNNVSAIRWTNNPSGTNTVWYAGFSFLTNAAFHDYRETSAVQTVQIDVGKLGAWIKNTAPNGGSNWSQELAEDTGHGIDSVYVYNAVPFIGQQQLPAVSVVDGSLLPNSTNNIYSVPVITSGLTVVTPQPLYVIGNYNVQIDGSSGSPGITNTAYTYPAGLLADAITVLSSNWLGDWSQTAYTSRPATNTAVNAACVAGIVPSTGGQKNGGDGTGAEYSGGIENYFRLLENWDPSSGQQTLTFNGSIAALFPSIYATNAWQLPENYYNIPTRNWAFDTNFLNPADLPPLTLVIVNSNAAPAITAQPVNEIVLTGQTTNFTVTATGVPAVSYQWISNGTNISWGTNASLVLRNIQLANAGNYTVQITNLLGILISSNATLSVYTSAAPVLDMLSFSKANGFQFTVSGVPGYLYMVEASTNLFNWTPLTTNNSPFNFADTNMSIPYRFYRSVYLP